MKNIKKTVMVIIVVSLLGLGFYFNQSEDYEITKLSYYEYFDTFIEVSIYDEVEDKKSIDEAIKKRLSEIHNTTDNFNDHDNDGLYDLNKYGEVTNPMLAELIDYAVYNYNEYSNQFNIALGPVVDIWKKALVECNEDNNCYVPTYEELVNAGNINANDILIENDSVKINDDMKLDLGGITKGYSADQIAEVLKSNGYKHFLINAGGNIYGTNKPNEESFIIDVVNPVSNNESFITLEIENKTVVTSGDYERYYEVDGKRYSHLINNETLYPSTYYKSVTIICDNSIDGDVLSTMLFGLEYEEGLNIIEMVDAEAIWYMEDGKILKSSGIDAYEKK